MLFEIHTHKPLIISKGHWAPASHLLSNPLIFFSTDKFLGGLEHTVLEESIFLNVSLAKLGPFQTAAHSVSLFGGFNSVVWILRASKKKDAKTNFVRLLNCKKQSAQLAN